METHQRHEENRLPDIRLRKFGFIFQDFNLLSATALEMGSS
jgi:ABC-type lipoprotein export system ATPase subunit